MIQFSQLNDSMDLVWYWFVNQYQLPTNDTSMELSCIIKAMLNGMVNSFHVDCDAINSKAISISLSSNCLRELFIVSLDLIYFCNTNRERMETRERHLLNVCVLTIMLPSKREYLRKWNLHVRRLCSKEIQTITNRLKKNEDHFDTKRIGMVMPNFTQN